MSFRWRPGATPGQSYVAHARSHYDWRASTNIKAFARGEYAGTRASDDRVPDRPISALVLALKYCEDWGPAIAGPTVAMRRCVDGHELFAAIEELRHAPRTRRLYTMLSPNHPWALRLQKYRPHGFLFTLITLFCRLLSVLQLGQLMALVFACSFGFGRSWACSWAPLRPRSRRELVALANGFNRRHVQVVGFNTGVTHFGHRYPGHTVFRQSVASELGTPPICALRVDCGVTVRQARDFLDRFGQELYVIPNYSYVCLGTALLVPIHRSAADYSTIAKTITEGVFYDPARIALFGLAGTMLLFGTSFSINSPTGSCCSSA